MSPTWRQIYRKTIMLNVLTGNPTMPFTGSGHYFYERIASGWMLYQNVDGDKDTCLRVAKKAMSAVEMLALLDHLLANPPANLLPPEPPKPINAQELMK